MNIFYSMVYCSAWGPSCESLVHLGVSSFFFSQLWSLGSPRSRCCKTRFLVQALFLACRRLPSCSALTWAYAVCFFVHWSIEWALVFFPLLLWTLIPLFLKPSWPLLNLIPFQRGLRLQHKSWGMGHKHSVHHTPFSFPQLELLFLYYPCHLIK